MQGNTSFSRILTLLRKERGLTQKEAAANLGISQA
ncbi:MAG: helix-turn-helix transcriptional regulator, partial [Oscillospiraceae bacterium]|nr:helix-turn-helix transcriptional regulator [Oscillospiraceae bacterium]